MRGIEGWTEVMWVVYFPQVRQPIQYPSPLPTGLTYPYVVATLTLLGISIVTITAGIGI